VVAVGSVVAVGVAAGVGVGVSVGAGVFVGVVTFVGVGGDLVGVGGATTVTLASSQKEELYLVGHLHCPRVYTVTHSPCAFIETVSGTHRSAG